MTQDTTTQPLNAGQQAAADGFFQFLLGNDKELIISGPGGVGKTFLMGYLIDRVIPEYQRTCEIIGVPSKYDDVMMTATTNKAAEVLSTSTNRPCETIHKFLNLTVKDDYSTGRSLLKKTSSWYCHQNKVIFIDEGSMIDSALLKELHEASANCKIVYVGDHCQLAPVMETLSPIYKKEVPFFHLTEPMRNSGQPALMNICNQLRNTVESGVFNPIQVVPGVIDWFHGEEMEDALKYYFDHQNPNARFLAYTNDKVEAYNNYIRGLRNLPEDFTVGELLVNNSAIRVKDSMISVEEEVVLEHMGDLEDAEVGDEDGFIQVRRCTLKSKYGTYNNVPVPANKQHFQEWLKYFKNHKQWKHYFDLKNYYPDLRPRDAATIHKAQGSTYDVVFIDLDDLSRKCHRADMAARLLYVGFTRARTRVIMFGDLAPKYGGIIQ